jgi:acetyl esterase/lipase
MPWRPLLPLIAAVILTGILPVRGDESPSAYKPPAGLALEEDVTYGRVGDLELKLDILRPEAKPKAPRPAIVWMHGGEHPRKVGLPRMAPLAQKGFFCVTIDYRSGKEAPFPARLEDAKCAVRFLRAKAADYRIDPGHIGAWGHSAGGHLAALLGTTAGMKEFEGSGGWAEQSSRVQAVCSWSGPTDLAHLLELRPTQADHLETYLGLPFDEDKTLLARASPVTYASKDAAPCFLVHGDQDPVIPVEQAVRLREALHAAGAEVTLHHVPEGGHGGKGFEVELAPTISFFETHLAKKP